MPAKPFDGPSPLIRMDLFPAIMRPGSVAEDNSIPFDPLAPYHEKCRVIITLDTMWVFVDTPDGPDLYFRARYDDISGSRQTGYRVTYTNGEGYQTAYTLIAAGGCGCGSSVKSYQPWSGGMRYAANTF